MLIKMDEWMATTERADIAHKCSSNLSLIFPGSFIQMWRPQSSGYLEVKTIRAGAWKGHCRDSEKSGIDSIPFLFFLFMWELSAFLYGIK